MNQALSLLRLDTVVGSWRLVRVLSADGVMGQLYEVEHVHQKNVAALKLLRPEFASDTMAIERFRREALAGARLRHTNLNQVLDAGDFAGRPFLVTPLLDGKNLRTWLNLLHGLPIGEALRVAREVCAGIGALHEQARAAHRDIKPENIFITYSGEVKVLDLGVAKFFSNFESFLSKSNTADGTGTIAYMAPEQLEGDATFSSDLFALGLVLYEMIAGRHPYVDTSWGWPDRETLIDRLLYDQPRPIDELIPESPHSVAALLNRCLAKSTLERPSSAKELYELLEREFLRWQQSHSSEPTESATFFALFREEDAGQTLAPEAPHKVGQLAPGTIVDYWRIVRLLSNANPQKGELYEVQHLVRKESATLRYFPFLHFDDLRIQPSDLETIFASNVIHSRLITILDTGAYNGRPFVVTPILEGKNLIAWLRERRSLPIDVAIQVAMEVCDALACLHAETLRAHGELTPENIFITHEGGVKVLAFGVRQVLGASAYLSPEQRSTEPLFASDIYSLALVLYEMVVGRRPARDANGRWRLWMVPEGSSNVPHAALPPLGHLMPQCPASLSALLTLCTAQSPADRPPSARELFNLLGKELDLCHQTAAAPPTSSSAAARDFRPARRWQFSTLWIAIVVLLLAALAIAVADHALRVSDGNPSRTVFLLTLSSGHGRDGLFFNHQHCM